jgi:hypothetical protein
MNTNPPKPPKVVVATEGCNPYLTAGKEYPVNSIWDEWDFLHGFGFNIIADNGYKLYCVENDCSHLRRDNWIIKEREQ